MTAITQVAVIGLRMIKIKKFSHAFVGVCYVMLYGHPLLTLGCAIHAYKWTGNRVWLTIPIALAIEHVCPNSNQVSSFQCAMVLSVELVFRRNDMDRKMGISGRGPTWFLGASAK